MFQGATTSERLADICLKIEAIFQVCFLLSGFLAADEKTGLQKKRLQPNISTHFHKLMDSSVKIGKHLTQDEFRRINGMEDAYAASKVEGRIDVISIKNILLCARDNLVHRLRGDLAEMQEAMLT